MTRTTAGVALASMSVARVVDLSSLGCLTGAYEYSGLPHALTSARFELALQAHQKLDAFRARDRVAKVLRRGICRRHVVRRWCRKAWRFARFIMSSLMPVRLRLFTVLPELAVIVANAVTGDGVEPGLWRYHGEQQRGGSKEGFPLPAPDFPSELLSEESGTGVRAVEGLSERVERQFSTGNFRRTAL